MHDAFRKLRSVAIEAYSKIVLRSTDHRPGKWPESGFTEEGLRDWRRCTSTFLFDKLDEEVVELKASLKDKNKDLDAIRKEAADVSAVAMMIADNAGCFDGSWRIQPNIVCLCGSTKFKDAFLAAQFRETMGGNIVVSVGAFGHADNILYRDSEKEHLDWLHKRKIDLADEILVINVGGYIGSSTKSEILYAVETGKAVRYLETVAPLPTVAVGD